jgi:hypothetical protein
VLNFVSTVFFFKSYVTIAPPHPPASIHVYLHYRVAAINPEFFSSYFEMTQHS